ncbi:transposase [Streptomyces sp. NPDC014995]|uniref:transposase n=1 Tax=Streptomyces sp. NPDC014995 TaxID=3364936 RepID=UPI0036FC10FD
MPNRSPTTTHPSTSSSSPTAHGAASDTTYVQALPTHLNRLPPPLLPVPACRTETGGHQERCPRRELVNGIRSIVDNGAKWRALPADLPPWETVHGFFWRWNRSGVATSIR